MADVWRKDRRQEMDWETGAKAHEAGLDTRLRRMVMEIPLSIDARNVDVTPAVEALIRRKVAWLERFCKPIIRCEVAVEGPARRRSGGPYEVRLTITVPPGEVKVARQQGPNLRIALREAFDASRRQLEDFAQCRRGETKNHEPQKRDRFAPLLAEEGYGV
jgi:ribosomal subunit interface protein